MTQEREDQQMIHIKGTEAIDQFLAGRNDMISEGSRLYLRSIPVSNVGDVGASWTEVLDEIVIPDPNIAVALSTFRHWNPYYYGSYAGGVAVSSCIAAYFEGQKERTGWKWKGHFPREDNPRLLIAGIGEIEVIRGAEARLLRVELINEFGNRWHEFSFKQALGQNTNEQEGSSG